MRLKHIIILLIVILAGVSCTKDLDEEFNNQPSKKDILSDPGNVESIANSLFHNWFMIMNSSWSPRMAMWVMADQGTCSWANVGMYHLSSEPRVSFNNLTSYTYARANEDFYEDLYGNLNYCNDVIKASNNGIFEEASINSAEIKTLAFFTQGLSLGYLGLVYDQAFIIKENTDDPMNVSLSPYMDVIEAGISSLDSVISNTPPSHELNKLANSYAARFLLHSSRNKSQNDQLDWGRVLQYAENGITEDYTLYMDDVDWISYWRQYTMPEDWARIDCRIIHLMDNDYPWHFPESGQNPPQAQSDDKRLDLYFSYIASHDMKPERGYYHFSNYDFRRNEYAISTFTTDITEYMAYEIDLIKAEAYVHLGDISSAVEIINQGPRVELIDPETNEVIPNLPLIDVNISADDLLEIIFYERDIELIMTGFGIAFFDMRRRDMLQYGTMLHFPIPGKELDVMSMPYYSFGGEENADGVGTSNGGWFPQ